VDFIVPAKTQAIVGKIRDFVDKELIPLEPLFLQSNTMDLAFVLESKREIVRQMGFWAPNHPKEYGGMGLDLIEHAYVSEVLGRTPLGHYVFGCQAPDAGNIEILHTFGTQKQKEQYLRPLVMGKIRSCFSMTEVEFPGSNPVMMDTVAVKDGEDYVINGHKWYTTAADGAHFAVVMAITNPEAPPHMRASMIIVPTKTHGFNQVRNISVMGHTGQGFFSHAEILYQNCRVPRSNLLGEEGKGFTIAQARLGPGRIHHCMRWMGI
jgi:alkylation response protein AidB-like acyl-CoA dehydrogenase